MGQQVLEEKPGCKLCVMVKRVLFLLPFFRFFSFFLRGVSFGLVPKFGDRGFLRIQTLWVPVPGKGSKLFTPKESDILVSKF